MVKAGDFFLKKKHKKYLLLTCYRMLTKKLSENRNPSRSCVWGRIERGWGRHYM